MNPIRAHYTRRLAALLRMELGELRQITASKSTAAVVSEVLRRSYPKGVEQ